MRKCEVVFALFFCRALENSWLDKRKGELAGLVHFDLWTALILYEQEVKKQQPR